MNRVDRDLAMRRKNLPIRSNEHCQKMGVSNDQVQALSADDSSELPQKDRWRVAASHPG